jgi:hypothetical protein
MPWTPFLNSSGFRLKGRKQVLGALLLRLIALCLVRASESRATCILPLIILKIIRRKSAPKIRKELFKNSIQVSDVGIDNIDNRDAGCSRAHRTV